jgi:hypothetical protein
MGAPPRNEENERTGGARAARPSNRPISRPAPFRRSSVIRRGADGDLTLRHSLVLGNTAVGDGGPGVGGGVFNDAR